MFAIYLIFSLILGLIIGSFLNCLIFRLYTEESLLTRSHCPKCKEKIHWYDNIPVLSFLILKGKCRYCEQKISWQYPVVEAITAILFALSFYILVVNGVDFLLLFKFWFIISVLIIFFVFDIKWQLIPINVVIFSSVVLLILNFFIGINWLQFVYAVLISFGFFGLQYFVSRGKWIGEGDVWLSVLLALVFPTVGKIILIIFLTYFIGALVSMVLLILKKREVGEKIPLAIFISLASIITLFLGSEIIGWYLSLF